MLLPEMQPQPQPQTDVLFGAYTYGGVWQGMEPVFATEAALGRPLDIVHWFTNWDNAFDLEMVEAASAGGRLPLISWEPHEKSLQNIVEGHYDTYLLEWAKGVRDYGDPVYIRPFPEMNGDWAPWNGEPDVLVAAWRHTVERFREAGAHNAFWVWSPNITDEPRTPQNAMERYYPGEDYVDVLALDGYNWGTSREWSTWRAFDDIFAAPYERVTALGSQPLWIAEIASVEEGGNKGKWIKGMLGSTAFPQLEAIVWFDENKSVDWRIRSSEGSLAAFQEWFAGEGEVAGF